VFVRALALTDFRGYADVDVAFGPGVSVLIGPNGQGKTNLVEALLYASTLESHRVATDAPLVRAGAERAVVRVAAVRDGREALVELEVNPGKANRARLNRSPVARPREVLGLIRSVLFAPEDLALVKGDPDGRRRFLDALLTLQQPRFAGVRADYDRVLRQRSTLLRSAAARRRGGQDGEMLATLTVWDEHLARHGADLLAGRLALLEALRPHAATAYEAVAPGGGGLALGYRHSLGEGVLEGLDRDALAQAILTALERLRPQEVERGQSLAGPHRDDLVLTLGELPAKGYASHGESWSAALALRLGSYALLRADGDDPVLVLDDVFAELDTSRRGALAELVAGAEQVLVTAAVAADVPPALAGARYAVATGTVTRA
jgi:DNA replication and repair protein RecF